MFKKPSELESFLAPKGAGKDTTESIIGPSVHLEGNFNSSGNIVIAGSLSGSLTTSGHVRVEEGAKVQASVSAAHIYVAGEVRGDIRATDQLELSATARVFGNIEAKVLSVTPGAILHGKCAMKANGLTKERKNEETKEQLAPRALKNLRTKEQKEEMSEFLSS